MPLCLDTARISDYGFTVKINELQRRDTGWQEGAVSKMGFIEIWQLCLAFFALPWDSLRTNFQPINYHNLAFWAPSRRLPDLSDLTVSCVNYVVRKEEKKSKRWTEGIVKRKYLKLLWSPGAHVRFNPSDPWRFINPPSLRQFENVCFVTLLSADDCQ